MTSFAADADAESITDGMGGLSISDKTSIFCFARMNPPHKGHGKLITSMLAIRKSLKTHGIQAHVHIILQEGVDSEKNPLTFEQRKKFILNYINYGPNLEEEDKQYISIIEQKTSQYAFQILCEEGFNKFYFLMGVDRREDFTSPTSTKYQPNMYNSVVSQGINWADLPSTIEKNKFFERGTYPYELKLKEFNDDHLLSNYYGMDFPVVEKNSIISIINPRPENPYQFLELGEKEKDRNVKSISATEIREAIRQVKLTSFTGQSIENIDDNNNLRSYDAAKPNAEFRKLVKNLILQGERGKSKKQKELTFKMIWTIKNQMFPGKEHTIIGYGTRNRGASRTRKASLSEKKKSSALMSPIRVLSYNTSWEATQPAVDWFIGPNLYGPPNGENGIGYMCGRKELYDDVKQSGPFEIGVLKDGETNRCVENIFNIIESGNYDLVGMQEYVHTWKDKPVFSEKMKKLNHLELVKHELLHMGINKYIEIGSLYNTNRFELIEEALSEFKIERKNRATNEITKNIDDGRPVQALLLRDRITGKYIIFLNAHFPQPRGISVNGSNEDRAKFVSDIMTDLVIKLITNSGANNKAVNSNNDIILAADTNDGNLDFLKYIVIYGKKMHLGANINTKNTCCTPLVKDITTTEDGHSLPPTWGDKRPFVTWKENETITRDSLRRRKGDVIMYSLDGEFEYVYPEENKDEPYSDHAPIATTLTAPAQNIGGRKRRTRRKRKRRRRKRTKKKRRRKSRKRRRRTRRKRRRR
jgi:hypothetical protein